LEEKLMSQESAYAFLEAIKTNEDLRNDVQDALEGKKKKSLVEVGHDYGFDFTLGELNQARKDHADDHPEDGPDTCVIL
jgi:predicted ribosomally synthesized peptide with nif11-like leader